MLIKKALIIRRLKNEFSMEYAEGCAKSCEQHGLPYEFIEAIEEVDCDTAFNLVGAWKHSNYSNTQGNCCCHASHIKCWARIVELGHACIVLEHDAVVKGDVTNINIPDMAAVTFGFRVSNEHDYTPIGPARELKEINRSVGVHACGLTPKTAEYLHNQAVTQGVGVGVDKWLMMHRKSGLPLYVCDPPQVVCWARVSTSNLQRSLRFSKVPRSQVFNYNDSLTDSWKKGIKK